MSSEVAAGPAEWFASARRRTRCVQLCRGASTGPFFFGEDLKSKATQAKLGAIRASHDPNHLHPYPLVMRETLLATLFGIIQLAMKCTRYRHGKYHAFLTPWVRCAVCIRCVNYRCFLPTATAIYCDPPGVLRRFMALLCNRSFRSGSDPGLMPEL